MASTTSDHEVLAAAHALMCLSRGVRDPNDPPNTATGPASGETSAAGANQGNVAISASVAAPIVATPVTVNTKVRWTSEEIDVLVMHRTAGMNADQMAHANILPGRTALVIRTQLGPLQRGVLPKYMEKDVDAMAAVTEMRKALGILKLP